MPSMIFAMKAIFKDKNEFIKSTHHLSKKSHIVGTNFPEFNATSKVCHRSLLYN